MSILKTTLAISAVLATVGLAGCQTTEERVYYSGAPVYTDPVVVVQTPRYRPPPVYVVGPRPRHIVGRPIWRESAPRWSEPPGGRYHPRPVYREPPAGGPRQPRWQGGPEPAPRGMRPPPPTY